MDFVTILGAAVILGIFVVIIVIAMKKTNEKLNEAISNLTEEEKDYLLHTEYQKAPDSDIAVYAPALVHSVKEKGNGAALYLIFCDTYFPKTFFCAAIYESPLLKLCQSKTSRNTTPSKTYR